MANKSNYPLLYSFDAGNGGCKGISTEIRSLIKFAPVIAPITEKKGLTAADEKPRFSLKVGGKDGQTLVFGVDDVFTHGKRAALRRLNSIERYTSPDYFNLLDVLFLQVFAGYRGNAEYITPTGTISIPAGLYANTSTPDEVKNSLAGKRSLVDHEGCELRLDINPRRISVVPEGYGALVHYAYDPKTLMIREDAALTGSTVVIDIGFETTDLILFEGTRLQRDQVFTVERAGLGNVVRAVQTELSKSIKGVDVSRLDAAMIRAAGIKAGAPKHIEVSPGINAEISEVYDQNMVDLAIKITQAVETHFADAPARYLLTGGGAYHLETFIRGSWSGAVPMIVAPDPESANVLGAFTALKRQAEKIS